MKLSLVKSISLLPHLGVGNITASAEFNFYVDPEAAHTTLSCLKCPLQVLAWEPCYFHNVMEWVSLNHIKSSIINNQLK